MEDFRNQTPRRIECMLATLAEQQNEQKVDVSYVENKMDASYISVAAKWKQDGC